MPAQARTKMHCARHRSSTLYRNIVPQDSCKTFRVAAQRGQNRLPRKCTVLSAPQAWQYRRGAVGSTQHRSVNLLRDVQGGRSDAVMHANRNDCRVRSTASMQMLQS